MIELINLIIMMLFETMLVIVVFDLNMWGEDVI